MQVRMKISQARSYVRNARRPAVPEVKQMIEDKLAVCGWWDESITIDVTPELAQKFVEKSVRPHHFRDGTTLKEMMTAALQAANANGAADSLVGEPVSEAEPIVDEQPDQAGNEAATSGSEDTPVATDETTAVGQDSVSAVAEGTSTS